MNDPDHMTIGQEVVLDNGERFCILGVQFLPAPGITLGYGRDGQKRWFLEAEYDTAVVWLVEYHAWRICGAKLWPVFNELAVSRAMNS